MARILVVETCFDCPYLEMIECVDKDFCRFHSIYLNSYNPDDNFCTLEKFKNDETTDIPLW